VVREYFLRKQVCFEVKRQEWVLQKRRAGWFAARLKNRRVIGILIVLAGMVLALLSLIPLHLFAPIDIFVNGAPPVVPALHEWHGSTGSFVLGDRSQIILDPLYADQLQATALNFQQDLRSETHFSLPIVVARDPGERNFFLTLRSQDSGIGDEGYLFNVDTSVTINARTITGIFYGTRTALQILQAAAYHASIPKGYARDYPLYKERGLMLDVGRKFVPLGQLEDYVRMMAWYKFNDFQLHFNDNALNGGNQPDWQHQYAAFRLNSPAFPGLAAPDGSYTEQQIRELEQVASANAVTITPEIDTPAHALALTQYRPDLASPKYSKEFLDLGNPATYTFIDSLWKTFLPWFTAPQVNMGMDEYDPHDADQYRNYINHYDTFLRQQGKTTRMWGSLSEIPSSISVHSDIVIEDWDNTWANPVDMVKQGFQIINANDLELYIVPHADYFHDFLDTQTLYTSWDPSVFSLHNPALNLQPDDPHLLGATFAVWNDKLGSEVSVNDITARLEPALPVLGEKMWNGSTQTLNYVQFEAVAQLVGQTPAIPLS
jgi:hexosaminidase